MSWRTVVIANRCKLDLKMGYMVIRGEETKRIFLDEISILIIENSAVSMTGCLLCALTEKKIKVIFCDEKRNPHCELLPYYGSHDCSRKLRNQLNWDDHICGTVWTMIIAEKISKQADLLAEIGKESEAALLRSYIENLEFYDCSNREGHAAKVYFNALFGMEFSRNNPCVTNAALNYGYSLILSAFNREIVLNGYNTELGLFHDNVFNQFNLSCDLMEPFRILIDRFVYRQRYEIFDSEQKHEMITVLNSQIKIASTHQTVLNGIKIYTKSVFDTLNREEHSCIESYDMI